MSRNLKFNLPKTCDNYEFKLVEELILWPHPASAHHGKLSVIGLWESHDILRSLSYENPLSLPNGLLCIPLIFPQNDQFQPELSYNKIVEVKGELQYQTNNKHLPNRVNSRHLMIQLQKKQLELEKEYKVPKRHPTGLCDASLHSSVKVSLLKMADEMKENYKPVILVHNISDVGAETARKLIAVNLKMRMLRKKIDTNF